MRGSTPPEVKVGIREQHYRDIWRRLSSWATAVTSSSLQIMIVEDEAVIALQLEDDLLQAGHVVIGWAIDTAGALALARDAHPDLALVDVHLQDGPTGVELGRRLCDMGCAVLFVTANAKRLPSDLAGAKGVIDKPFTPATLRRGLDSVLGAVD